MCPNLSIQKLSCNKKSIKISTTTDREKKRVKKKNPPFKYLTASAPAPASGQQSKMGPASFGPSAYFSSANGGASQKLPFFCIFLHPNYFLYFHGCVVMSPMWNVSDFFSDLRVESCVYMCQTVWSISRVNILILSNVFINDPKGHFYNLRNVSYFR